MTVSRVIPRLVGMWSADMRQAQIPPATAGTDATNSRSHTSRIALAELKVRAGGEFPFACPGCAVDIRLIAYITVTEPIRKILTHLGESLEPPSSSPAPGPPTDWVELVQVHDYLASFQASLAGLPVIAIHSL